MKIEILGAHNAETSKTRLPCLLIDGVIALDAGGLTGSLTLEQQNKIRAVLLTHHHFDHTRDLVTLGFNNTVPPSTIDIYGLRDTLEVVYLYLLDGKLYIDFTQWPKGQSPRFQLKPVAPFQQLSIEGYRVVPVPVKHSVPAAGYEIGRQNGGSIFYAGDTSAGLADCWQSISPRIIFIEVTAPNRMEAVMKAVGHLTPALLAEEMRQFNAIKGYMPRVIATHVTVPCEDEVKAELEAVSRELGAEIQVAYEGMVIEI